MEEMGAEEAEHHSFHTFHRSVLLFSLPAEEASKANKNLRRVDFGRPSRVASASVATRGAYPAYVSTADALGGQKNAPIQVRAGARK